MDLNPASYPQIYGRNHAESFCLAQQALASLKDRPTK